MAALEQTLDMGTWDRSESCHFLRTPSPKPPATYQACLTYHGSPAPRGEFPEPRVPQTAACVLAQDTRCPDFDKPLPLQAPTTHSQGTAFFNPGVVIREPAPKPDWFSKLPQQPIQRSTNSQFCPRGQWAYFSQSNAHKGDVHLSRFPTWTRPQAIFHKKAGGPAGGLTKQGTSMVRDGNDGDN